MLIGGQVGFQNDSITHSVNFLGDFTFKEPNLPKLLRWVLEIKQFFRYLSENIIKRKHLDTFFVNSMLKIGIFILRNFDCLLLLL